LHNSKTKEITDDEITENIKARIQDTDIDFEENDEEKLKLNTVRKTLYKLYSAKLAQFRRVRDKNTGWFIYYWWHDFDKLNEILLEKEQLINGKLRDRLKFELNNYFFICEKCRRPDTRFKFDEAVDLNFKCPTCEGILVADENKDIIAFLKEKIVLLQDKINHF
jgi:transcription initiation factor TFIIE subunit alpha